MPGTAEDHLCHLSSVSLCGNFQKAHENGVEENFHPVVVSVYAE